MAQPGWQYLRSAGMKLRCLALHNELWIWHCHSCSLGHNCTLDLIPQMLRGGKKKKKLKKKKKKGGRRVVGGG